ncbi:MAG TPA: HTH domain-containing protein [Candidatus Merdibacter merdavium]|uniref:HTH domain-containing protein n=1 Tax=Candidatus Merdibacter merdavium TaxID=2838692 RepID=A0A9D2NQ80_9FIRM|nr:HTH domain-containing protein [Candidatus Merdibacter merdavium]
MRMLKIIDLLLEEERPTVSALSARLKLSTRQIRYDIECINQLHEGRQLLIETDNKGVLSVKDEGTLRMLRHNAESVSYLQPQRLLYMRMILAFDLESYNLSRIAEELSVSRMTVRNDMQLLEEELRENGLSIRYQHGYTLSGSVQSFFTYRCKALYQMKYLLFKEECNTMEKRLKEHFYRHFFPARLAEVVPVLMSFLHRQDIWLDDAEFHHIYTKVLVILWYSYNERSLPPVTEYLSLSCPDLSTLFQQLEEIGITLWHEARNYMSYTFQCIVQYHEAAKQRYGNDAIVFLHQLLNALEDGEEARFSQDVFLLSNLFAHLCHFMHRQNYHMISAKHPEDEVKLDEQTETRLRAFCASHHELFSLQSEEEIALIRLYLACSVERMKTQEPVRVLFVSGASMQLQQHLVQDLSQYYHIEVIGRLSMFELPFYHAWQNAQLVLTTEHIPEDFVCPHPVQKISLILREEDHLALQQAGLPRRRISEPSDQRHVEPVTICQEEHLDQQGTLASSLPFVQLRFRLSLDRQISYCREDGSRFIILVEAQDAISLLWLLNRLYRGLKDIGAKEDITKHIAAALEYDDTENEE